MVRSLEQTVLLTHNETTKKINGYQL